MPQKMNECMEKYLSIVIWKENTADIIGTIVLICYVKVTMADLRKVGLKMRQ